jgi:hypothetical protein
MSRRAGDQPERFQFASFRSRRCSAQLHLRLWGLADGLGCSTRFSYLREPKVAIPRRGIQRLQPSELRHDQRDLLSAWPDMHLWASHWNAGEHFGHLESALSTGRAALDAVRAQVNLLSCNSSVLEARVCRYQRFPWVVIHLAVGSLGEATAWLGVIARG